jgi:hypothetical protein
MRAEKALLYDNRATTIQLDESALSKCQTARWTKRLVEEVRRRQFEMIVQLSRGLEGRTEVEREEREKEEEEERPREE